MTPRLQSIRPSLGWVLRLQRCSAVITQSRPASVIHMQMLLNPPLFYVCLFVFNPTTARVLFFCSVFLLQHLLLLLPVRSLSPKNKNRGKKGRLNMDGTEMLIGRAVGACARKSEPRHFVLPPFPCAHPFFPPSFLPHSPPLIP